MDTMSELLGTQRIHIAPVGFEVDRIVIPASKYKADKVYLLIHDNSSEGTWAGISQGIGIYVSFNSFLTLNNSIIYNNNCLETPSTGGIAVGPDSNIELINSIIKNNSSNDIGEFGGIINAIFSNIQGGWEGEGNIDSDPQFTDPENGDFTLQPTSPCIDAGSGTDPDGTIADMGAYYYDQIENPIVYGCTDPGACNYNEEATIDDGSCEYFTDLCGEECGDNTSCEIITDTQPDIIAFQEIKKQGWFYKLMENLPEYLIVLSYMVFLSFSPGPNNILCSVNSTKYGGAGGTSLGTASLHSASNKVTRVATYTEFVDPELRLYLPRKPR